MTYQAVIVKQISHQAITVTLGTRGLMKDELSDPAKHYMYTTQKVLISVICDKE